MISDRPDRFLLCFYAVLFRLSHLSSSFWILGMGALRFLLLHIRHCERPLVRHFRGVLEAPGSRPELALGVKGVSAIQDKRHDFKHEKEIKDPVTGEIMRMFPAKKRLARQTLSIPFALLAAIALGTLIATCFGIEIFISEIYNGPFKSGLVSLKYRDNQEVR